MTWPDFRCSPCGNGQCTGRGCGGICECRCHKPSTSEGVPSSGGRKFTVQRNGCEVEMAWVDEAIYHGNGDALFTPEDAVTLGEALILNRLQACSTCGAGYEVGTQCSTCAFQVRMATETCAHAADRHGPEMGCVECRCSSTTGHSASKETIKCEHHGTACQSLHAAHPSGDCLTNEGKRQQRDYSDRILAARGKLEAATLRLVAEHVEQVAQVNAAPVKWLRMLADNPAELSLLAVTPEECMESLEGRET